MSTPVPSERWVGSWLALTVGALLLRVYYTALAVVDNPLRADAGQYFRVALNVVLHGTYSTASPDAASVPPDSYRAPGYPTLIAVLFWLDGDGSYDALLAIQCVLGACTVGFSILLASRMMPKNYAFATGVLVGVWPHLITMGGYALTETLFGFLLSASAWLVVKALERPKIGITLLAGMCLAAAALVNQIALCLAPLIALSFTKRDWKVWVFLAAALAPPLLWSVRDSQIQSPAGLSASSRLMENVLIGMEPDFVPRYKPEAGIPTAVVARERISAGLNAYSVDSKKAVYDIWKRMSERPIYYLVWYLTKPEQFWSWSIVQGQGDIYEYPMLVAPFNSSFPLRLIASVCRGLNPLLMLAALGGAILTFAGKAPLRSAPANTVVVLIAVYATVIHSILTPDVRYSIPFRPFEIILAMLATRSAMVLLAKVVRSQKALQSTP